MSKNKKKCLVVPGTSFLHAYAGTRYLIEGLVAHGIDVELLVRCEEGLVSEYRRLPWKIKVYPYSRSQHVLLRKLTGLWFKTQILLRALASKNLLITESTHLYVAIWAKRIKPALRLIQFCQELQLPEDYPHSKYAHLYAQYAGVPDLVIDVEPQRASARKQKMGLSHDPLVLLNTIPQAGMIKSGPGGMLAKLAGIIFPEGMPVLLHAGGIGKEKPLERVIDAVALAKRDVFLLAFCNGQEKDIIRLAEYAGTKLKPDSFCIRAAVPRHQLLPALREADIGVIDYTYSVEPTLNQKYCAPTKLFEFMAYGLALLGSANASLHEIIEKNDIGACAKDDSIGALSTALNKLLEFNESDLHALKTRARRVFEELYSYEKCCAAPLDELVGYLKK